MGWLGWIGSMDGKDGIADIDGMAHLNGWDGLEG